MGRPRRLEREELMASARNAVRMDPDISVADFRKEVGGSTNDALHALSAAKYEIGHGQYRHVDPNGFGRFTPLVIAPKADSPASELDLERVPGVLRTRIDDALAGMHEAFGGAIGAMRAVAERLIADADARAKKDVVAAQDELRLLAGERDALELEMSRASEQTVQVRHELGAKLAQVERELAEVRHNHAAARDELARSQGDVRSAQAAAESLREQLLTSDHERELAAKQASALEAQNRELHHHLEHARDEVREAREALASAQSRAVHAEATLASTREAHGRELSYLQPGSGRARTGATSDGHAGEPKRSRAGRSRSR